MRIHQVPPQKYHTYLKKKLRKSRLSDRFFKLFLVISDVLYSENSDFQDLIVLGDFYDKVSANIASWFPKRYKKADGSQDAHRGYPDISAKYICQINCWNNIFQNMYGMNRQKLTVWPGKSIFCKTPQKRLFLCARVGVTWFWKDLDAKQLTPGQLLG